MPEPDLDAWEPQEPPAGFADRVVTEALRERRAPARGARIAVGMLLAAAMAALVMLGLHLGRANVRGDVTADARREVRVGTRAVAVLEKGAHVSWDGDEVAQSGGDVFWRVEPGARFTVATPAADVTVKGTCFRVKVRGGEEDMTRRDMASGAVGAALATAAFVAVYEGKVAVSHAGQSVDVAAGAAAQADGQGVKLVPDAAAGAQAFDQQGTEAEKAYAQANANLTDQVQSYRRRLEAIQTEKQKLEKQLAAAEAQLSDGGAPRSEFDLSPDERKQLAREGNLRIRLPCKTDKGWGPTGSAIDKLGLAPQDAPAVKSAFESSGKRIWAAVKPACASALGGADVAEKVGEGACVQIVMELARINDSKGYDETVRQVAEIEAGMRPPPGPNDTVSPFERMMLALGGELPVLESDLAKSLGPEDAHRIVFSDQGCWSNSGMGVGPRESEE